LSQTDGYVGISGEIKIQLERKTHQDKPRQPGSDEGLDKLKTGVIIFARKSAINTFLAKPIIKRRIPDATSSGVTSNLPICSFKVP
jgi:hypothetical protein